MWIKNIRSLISRSDRLDKVTNFLKNEDLRDSFYFFFRIFGSTNSDVGYAWNSKN